MCAFEIIIRGMGCSQLAISVPVKLGIYGSRNFSPKLGGTHSTLGHFFLLKIIWNIYLFLYKKHKLSILSYIQCKIIPSCRQPSGKIIYFFSKNHKVLILLIIQCKVIPSHWRRSENIYLFLYDNYKILMLSIIQYKIISSYRQSSEIIHLFPHKNHKATDHSM